MSDAASAPAAKPFGALDRDNPWPGLAPFTEADHGWFRGREREAEALSRRVRRERLTVLFGQSGLGKSSLLQAGLFPRVRGEGLLPVYLRLDFSGDLPDLVAQVQQATLQAVAAAGAEAPELHPGDGLWQSFHRQDADFWSARNRLIQPFLVFDQFEEIFTVGRGSATRAAATEAFLVELESLVEGAPPPALTAQLDEHPDEAEGYVFDRHPYKVLLALREDFLADLEELRQRIGSVGRNRFRLGPMDGEAALTVAGQAAHLMDVEVAEQVVRFVAAARQPNTALGELRVEPALLSVVCRELNHQSRMAGEAKITAGLLAGRQEEILSDFYERSVSELPSAVRTFVEEQLLTVSGYRDSVAMDNALGTSGLTPEAVDELVAGRLLRVEDRGGVQRLELTHDLLTGVIAASRDRRRRQEAEEAERVARRQAEERERQAREQLRHSQRLGGLLLTLTILAIAAAAWAFQAQRTAVRAELEALAQKEIAEHNQHRARVAQEAMLQHQSRAQQEEQRALEAEANAQRQASVAQEADRELLRQQGISQEQARQATELAAVLEQERLGREEEQRLRRAGDQRAEEAKQRAEEERGRVLQTLRDQLGSPDAGTVWAAVDRLVAEHQQQPRALAAAFPAERLGARRAFAKLAWGLYRAGDEAGNRDMAWQILDALRARWIVTAGLPTPPTGPDDEQLNRRILVPAGAFQLGSPAGEGEEDEHPQHPVMLSSFYVQEHEVTNREYQRFDPDHEPGAAADFPVVGVSWFDAMAYAVWLGGRLPTEAEWEVAARAGAETAYAFGDDPRQLGRYAWYHASSGGRWQPAGRFAPEPREPNRWGLSDMHGNVWEWVADWYGSYSAAPQKNPWGPPGGGVRVKRGGGFGNPAETLRAANRSWNAPEVRDGGLGFRVAFSVAPN